MHRRSFLVLLPALAGLLSLPAARASGSYNLRPPKPPSADTTGKTLDRERYRLGQKLYAGKIPLTADAPAPPQRERLERAQAMLPPETASKKDLPGLAGRLTEDQLAALEYYVSRRYSR